jgi:type IV pilus assembly protein PilY1
LASLLSVNNAHAQADINLPPPNMLLLVDTSGSMDYKSASTSFPTCKYSGTTPTAATSERSRWINLVEVLTGSIDDYECQRLDRSSAGFKAEYDIGGTAPYDLLYPNPYNRPVNKDCVLGPGAWVSASPAAWDSATSLKSHKFDNTTQTCNFMQKPDGILDAFRDDVRFGLMTFDTEPRGGKDLSGLWSYYLGTSPVQGKPEGCDTMQDQEVGVRNASAPPWEGRAVGFGSPVADTAALRARNDMVQKVLISTRPYGATPIAGMLKDALDYYLNDTSPDPLDSSFKFGPGEDKAGPGSCRRQGIILLSDGQPNMDLRPYCEPSNCPYSKAEDIAAQLKTAGVPIYVIGFGLATVNVNGTPTSCAGLDMGPSGPCPGTDPNLQACCALNRIAAAGGPNFVTGTNTDVDDPNWTHAHFADNPITLRNELSAAIGANFSVTSRVAPITTGGSAFQIKGGDPSFARGARFTAAFAPGTAGQAWIGKLTRQRYQCKAESGVNVPTLVDFKPSEGDDFVANVNASGPDARVIYTALSTSKLDETLRPNLALVDNEGVGTTTATMGKYTSTSFASTVSADNMQLTATSCDAGGVSITKDQCRDRVLKWLVGLDNGTGNTRCRDVSGGKCNLVGDFLRSAPRPVSGRPSGILSDASYDAFIKAQDDAKRPSVLYASSNDGFLHAFKMGPVSPITEPEVMSTRTKETNELWTFVPPSVLPGLIGSYPGTHQLLLDGTPTVKDVVATEQAMATGYKFKLNRSKSDAEAGAGTWRTILVQGYGSVRPGYFAIDITDPVPGVGKGPQFLWQLVNDEAGNQLFGSGGATPLITTVFLAGEGEVAVAVLPGGTGAAPSAGTCTRATDVSTYATGYKPRQNVPCYTATSSVLARSLTIVRLDTGKVLRTFRRDPNEVPKLRDNMLVTTTPLDSPLTGQPVAFPSEVGTVADRIFIGDKDGTLWRVNLAGTPADWKMDLFFDTFPGDGTFTHTKDDGQPIVTPPIISIDDGGNLTVAVSTGDQEALASSASTVNYVWSLTEKPNSARTAFNAVPNWHLDFKGSDQGFRVIGTMALFARTLYFAAMNRPSSGACAQGVGRVYGMDYIKPIESATAGKGGTPATGFGTLSAPYLTAADVTGGSGEAFLAGVSIGQEPTCENGGGTGDDEYFKYGAHYALGTPRGGGFKLYVSTGSTKPTPTRSDIKALDSGASFAASIDLASPAIATRVDSWAAIVE